MEMSGVALAKLCVCVCVCVQEGGGVWDIYKASQSGSVPH